MLDRGHIPPIGPQPC